MAITPNEIKNAAFSPAHSEVGYDTIEVDDFLDRLAEETDRLMKRVVELKTRYTQAEGRAQALAGEVTGLRQQLAKQEKTRVEGQLSETQLSEVFVIAKQTADRMVADAEDKANGIVSDAETRANEIIRQALVDKQSEIDEINRLQQSRANFLQEYQGLLRSYLEDSATRIPISQANMEGMVAENADAAIEYDASDMTATA
jgi:cell division initiation protein